MRIIEMFKSIQGEGNYIGVPSIFIRFNECNLKCSWCDTKYSWDSITEYDWRNAVRFIRADPAYRHIVFTGGEPLLKENQEEMLRIIQNTMSSSSIITIETNGTLLPDIDIRLILKEKGLWSVSPKLYCLESYDPATLRYFDSTKNHQWKFVITNITRDMKLIHELINQGMVSIDINNPIILQPNGMILNYEDACKQLAEYIIDNNLTMFRVLPQFHKICWGNRRGI